MTSENDFATRYYGIDQKLNYKVYVQIITFTTRLSVLNKLFKYIMLANSVVQ